MAGAGDWDGRSDRWIWLIRLGSWVVDHLGFRGVSLISLPIAWATVLAVPQRRSIGADYWRRVRPGIDRATAAGLTARQLAGFARILCDRALAYRKPFGYQRVNPESLWATAKGPAGFILLSAHIGNWELAGRLFGRIDPDRRVNLVKVENEDPRERALVEAAMGDRPPRVIDPRDPVAASLAIRQALERGEVVCFLGDRVHGAQHALEVPVLGAPVRLPTGPFQVAQLTGAAIVRCFMVRIGPGRYRLEADAPFHIPSPPSRAQRREAVAAAVADWARRLEQQVRRFPFQWHNFYRYWG